MPLSLLLRAGRAGPRPVQAFRSQVVPRALTPSLPRIHEVWGIVGRGTGVLLAVEVSGRLPTWPGQVQYLSRRRTESNLAKSKSFRLFGFSALIEFLFDFRRFDRWRFPQCGLFVSFWAFRIFQVFSSRAG